MAGWQSYLEGQQERYLQEMLEFLAIPSVSSLPEHREDVQDAARWVAARIKARTGR